MGIVIFFVVGGCLLAFIIAWLIADDKKEAAQAKLQNDLNQAMYARLCLDNEMMHTMKALLHETRPAPATKQPEHTPKK